MDCFFLSVGRPPAPDARRRCWSCLFLSGRQIRPTLHPLTCCFHDSTTSGPHTRDPVRVPDAAAAGAGAAAGASVWRVGKVGVCWGAGWRLAVLSAPRGALRSLGTDAGWEAGRRPGVGGAGGGRNLERRSTFFAASRRPLVATPPPASPAPAAAAKATTSSTLAIDRQRASLRIVEAGVKEAGRSR